MQPLTFPCAACGRLMGVGMESAGRPVRCPHCQQVVTAPTPAAPAAPTPHFAPLPKREGFESIFSDPGESQDGLFGATPQRTLDLPATQPIPIPPQMPFVSSQPTAAPPYVPAMAPYQLPPPPETFEPTDAASPAAKRAARERTVGQFPMKETALAGLAVYALVMTVIAIIGWTRKPASAPATHPPNTATTSVTKPRK